MWCVPPLLGLGHFRVASYVSYECNITEVCNTACINGTHHSIPTSYCWIKSFPPLLLSSYSSMLLHMELRIACYEEKSIIKSWNFLCKHYSIKTKFICPSVNRQIQGNRTNIECSELFSGKNFLTIIFNPLTI